MLLFSVLSSLLPGLSARQTEQEQKLIVQDIEITGNSKTRPNVIYNYLTFKIDDPITPEAIEASRKQLAAINFFRQVEIYTKPGSKKGAIIAVIEVQERRWPYFQFAGGHSDLDGWYFVPARFRFDNLIGRGNLLAAEIYLSDRTSKFSIHYAYPFLFDGSANLQAELYGGGRQYIHYLNGLEAQQNVDFGGVKLTLEGNEGIFRFIKLGIQKEEFLPDDWLKFSKNDSVITGFFIPANLRPLEQFNRVAAFSLTLGYDGRDNLYYPQRGFWGAAIYEKATTELNSDFQFNRTFIDGRYYQRIFKNHVFAINVKSAFASRGTPFFKRFYLGGANSLRGFAERRLTPVGYGTKLLLANVEYRFPLTQKKRMEPPVFAVLFYSQGGLWQNGEDISNNSMFKSLGFGLRFRLPVLGLTRVDFAFPTTVLNDEDFQLHISLGQTF